MNAWNYKKTRKLACPLWKTISLTPQEGENSGISRLERSLYPLQEIMDQGKKYDPLAIL